MDDFVRLKARKLLLGELAAEALPDDLVYLRHITDDHKMTSEKLSVFSEGVARGEKRSLHRWLSLDWHTLRPDPVLLSP